MWKRMLVAAGLGLAVLVPGRAAAQDSSIGVYADSNATRTHAVFTAGVPTTIYITAKCGADIPEGITGAEFRVVGLPDGWLYTLTPNPNANIVLGDPLRPAGEQWYCNIAFPLCQPRTPIHIVLFRIEILPTTDVVNRVMTVEAALPPSNPNFNAPLLVLCDAPRFTLVRVAGGRFVINQELDYEVRPCDLDVSDVQPALGQPIHFQSVVRNSGGVGSAAPVPVRFLLDGVPVGADVPAGPIAAGDSVLVASSVSWTVDFAPHVLQVVVDPDSTAEEFSEENNAAECRLPYELHPVVLPACPPEDGSMFSNCSPCLGDSVSIRTLVANTGLFQVDSVRVEFRDGFPGAGTLGTAVVYDLHRSDCPPLTSGEATIAHRFLRRGDHPIEVLVDPDDAWPEFDETDNHYAQTVAVDCFPPAWFDYAVASCDVGVSDVRPTLGQPIQFQAWVHNIGSRDSFEPVGVRFFLDSLVVGEDVLVGPIPVGDSVLVSSSLPWTVDFAPHVLQVVVDPDSTAEEFSEENNAAECRLPYELHPVVLPACPPEDGSMFSNCSPCLGDSVSIRTLVANTGLFQVDSVRVEFRDGYPGAGVIGSAVVYDLRRCDCPPGSSREAAIAHRFLHRGDHPIEILVDPGDDWPEFDETDNRYAQTATVDCFPPAWFDYAVAACDVGVSDVRPTLGQPIHFQAWVHNTGDRDSFEPVGVRFLLDSIAVGTDVQVGPIAAGDSILVSASVPWNVDFEPHVLQVAVDPDSLQEEPSRADNRASCILPYELHPVALPACPPEAGSMFSNCSPCLGDSVSIRALVANTGLFQVDSIRVEFRDGFPGAGTIGTAVVYDLRRSGCPPGSSREATIEHRFLRRGDHPIEIAVDPGDDWPEFDETDNRYAQTMTVDCFPPAWFDYALASCDVGVSDVRPAPGQPIHFQAWVHNTGDRDSFEPVGVRFLLDSLVVGADVSVGPIAAGDSVLVSSSVPWNVDFEPHVLQVAVDPDSLQEEPSRVDNRASCILPYELHPIALPACPPEAGSMFSDCSPCVGDSVSIRALVANTGLFQVDSVRVEFRDGFPGAGVIGSAVVYDLRRSDCPPGSSREATIAHRFLHRGDHPIEVVVDPGNVWPEFDEADNVYGRTLAVPCIVAPDLIVGALEIEPPHWNLEPGDRIDSVAVWVQNHGRIDATGVRVRVTFADSQFCDDFSIGDVPVHAGVWGGCHTGWVVPEGMYGFYPLVACADPEDSIPEDDEGNNCRLRWIPVGHFVPVTLTDLEARSNTDGLLLQWKARPDFDRFGIERRPASGIAWQALTWISAHQVEAGRYADYAYLDGTAEAGATYEYRILGVGRSSEVTVLGALTALFTPPLPARLTLYPNVPNPFNPVTRIQLAVPERRHVDVRIHDAVGRLVVELWSGTLDAGRHTLVWHGEDTAGRPLPSGVYYCTAAAANEAQTRKLLLLK